MHQGFIKVAAVTPKIKLADTEYNAGVVIAQMKQAMEKKAKLIVFPELFLTGYTCNDLFFQETLLKGAEEALLMVVEASRGNDAVVFVGLPLEQSGKLYNVAAVVQDGRVLALIPKKNIPNYAEFYEARYFTPGPAAVTDISFHGQMVPFGTNLLLTCTNMPGLVVASEICEDIWVADPPSTMHAMAGATIIVNLSASDETIGKYDYRRLLVQSVSGRLLAGYVYSSAAQGESTQDMVFDGHNMIAENGCILRESGRFTCETIYCDLDVNRLQMERRKNRVYTDQSVKYDKDYRQVPFLLTMAATELERTFDPLPFVPSDQNKREKRCEEILSIQAYGLARRYEHTGCKKAVIGLSGGLDSTLALLVTVKAFDLNGLDRKDIIAVTMPCFGTTDRTKNNAVALSEALGVTLREIPLKKSVLQHFEDIGHDVEVKDVTYENSQARERTQVLMDLANQENALVIGTGDMSELALGWATYNGDHMSMYGVNAGVPKTLVRHLVSYYADTCSTEKLSEVLQDVLDTPVSPELLPPQDGQISQKTEDIVGPYELHDFFLYYMLRMSYGPAKIYRIARIAFQGMYSEEEIRKWIKVFYHRFFTQQFKRSCLPDGPKVGSVALSPRGDLRMPSDASAALWMKELDSILTGNGI